MLTIISYYTNNRYLAYHLRKHKVINVMPGDRLMDILESGDVTEEVLFQINLSNYSSFFSDTDFPHELVVKSGRRVLNNGMTDISKTKIHKILESLELPCLKVNRNEVGDNDQVFVKSNLNYGALHERNLPENILGRLGIEYSFELVPKNDEYKKYAVKNIPESYWSHEGLVIEKFIENKNESYLRVYKNNDNYALSCAFIPGKDIKKMDVGVRRENIFLHADDISKTENVSYRNALIDVSKFFNSQQIDFGTVDVLTDDTNTNFIIDFNHTPHWGEEDQSEFLSFLSSGE